MNHKEKIFKPLTEERKQELTKASKEILAIFHKYNANPREIMITLRVLKKGLILAIKKSREEKKDEIPNFNRHRKE